MGLCAPGALVRGRDAPTTLGDDASREPHFRLAAGGAVPPGTVPRSSPHPRPMRLARLQPGDFLDVAILGAPRDDRLRDDRPRDDRGGDRGGRDGGDRGDRGRHESRR